MNDTDACTGSAVMPLEMMAGPETLERKAARINESAHELDNMLTDIRAKLFGPRLEADCKKGTNNDCLESALDIAVDTLSGARKNATEMLERL